MGDRTEDRAFELLKKLVKNVQLSSKKILILITGIVISAFITFIRPQIVSTLTDAGLAKKNFMNIVFWCAILLICAVFEYGNGLLQIKIFVKMNNQFVEDMYRMALNKILKAPYRYSQNRTSAELLSTINNDISRLSLLLDRSSLLMLQFLFQIVGGTVGLLLLNWKMALILLIILPMKQFIVNWLARNKTRLTEDYIGELQKFGKWFGNQTSGIIEIKLWNERQNIKSEIERSGGIKVYLNIVPKYLDIAVSEEENEVDFLTLSSDFVKNKINMYHAEDVYCVNDFTSLNDLIIELIEELASYVEDVKCECEDLKTFNMDIKDVEKCISDIFEKIGLTKDLIQKAKQESIFGNKIRMRARELLIVFLEIERVFNIYFTEEEINDFSFASINSIIECVKKHLKNKSDVINK